MTQPLTPPLSSQAPYHCPTCRKLVNLVPGNSAQPVGRVAPPEPDIYRCDDCDIDYWLVRGRLVAA